MGREITPKMRAVLIDWLVEVQQEYKLLQETLHITIGILDTYLQVNFFVFTGKFLHIVPF